MKKPNIFEFFATIKAKEIKKLVKEIEHAKIGDTLTLQTKNQLLIKLIIIK